MNIIKIQNQLKGVPDDALVGYVQNPTGSVPTYLALSELQRRKEMRDKYQANVPEESSVAEDLLQEAQPQPEMEGVAGLPEAQPMMQAMQAPPEMPVEEMAQGGLAELDTGDMYDENSYATGGIVAFDEGGHVPSYAGPEGSYVQSGDTNIFGFKRGTSLMDRFFPSPFDNAPPAIIPQLMGEKARLEKEIQKDPSKSYANYERIKEIDAQLAEARAPRQVGGYEPPKGSSPALTNAEVSIKNQIEEAKKNPFADITKEVYSGSIAPVEKVGSLKSYADEFKEYIGDDPSRKKLADRLAKMEAKATKMEEQAPWLALAKAGFEMASARPEYGKGQSALADIARGAGVGVKDYAESVDRLNTLEEKRFNIENDLAKANRAEQIAVAKYGADSKQAAEARAHADRLHNSSIKTQFKIAELNASVNSGYRMATVKDKIDDNVRAKIKDLIAMGTGPTTEDEYNKVFKKLLAEEYAKYGLSGAPAVTSTPESTLKPADKGSGAAYKFGY